MSDDDRSQPLGDPIPVDPDLRATLEHNETAPAGERPRGRGRRRRTRIIVLVALTVVVLAAATVGALFVTMAKPPLDAANAYFGDLATGDFTGAYRRLCAETKEAVTVEQYTTEMERSLAGVFAIDGYTANPIVDVDGSRASVDMEVTYADAGTRDVTLDLREEGGDWRPCIDADQFTVTSAPTTTAPTTTAPAAPTTVAPEPAST